MGKAKEENEKDREERAHLQSERAEQESEADELDAEETKKFERPDNLRRRSEWFQKRTGGG